jgi:predicted  nucleic acid-binding Zn-ribbon protein
MIVTLGGSTPVPSKTAELRAQQADLDETLSKLKLRQVELELALSGVKEDIAEVRKQRDELEQQIVDTINSPLTTAPVSPNQSQ